MESEDSHMPARFFLVQNKKTEMGRGWNWGNHLYLSENANSRFVYSCQRIYKALCVNHVILRIFLQSVRANIVLSSTLHGNF